MLRWVAECYCERFGRGLLLGSSELMDGLNGALSVL
jgi:hypothetical protein